MVGWRRAILPALVVALAGAQGALAGVLVIDGAGDGHGVGLSQTGAAGLAAHGYSAQQILTHYYTGTNVERLGSERAVSVLIQSGLRTVAFSDAAAAGDRALLVDRTYLATAAGNGEIALESERGRLLSYLPAPLQITSAIPIRFDGTASSGVVDGRYRGSLTLALGRRGRIEVINHVGLEAYLLGVVPAESPAYWPAAELEAQAIAARSYAIASRPQAGFDLYGDTRSQQYGGYDAEAPSTDDAVEATRGEVVAYHGRPIVAYYFASSGGETEDVQNGFPGATPEPYLRAVIDPYDASRFGPITLSLHQADRRLRHLLLGTLEAIVVTRRGASPRIVSARLVGSGGTTTVSGSELAAALGLPSTWDCFSVSSSAATVASGWDRACERPTRLGTGTTRARAPVSTGGGTVAGSGSAKRTGTGRPAPSEPGSVAGGAVAPSGQ
jgi:stage II sporulation protein D